MVALDLHLHNSSPQHRLSLIGAFGNYSGGELFHEDDNGDAYYKLKE